MKMKAKSNAQCEQSGAKITAVVRSNPTTPTDTHHGPESQAKNSSQTTPTQVNVKDGHMIDLKSCSNIRYDKRDAVHGIAILLHW